MKANNPDLCHLQTWDTEFFRLRIARVCGDTLNEVQVPAIDNWSRNQRIQGLYFLARADDPATILTAGSHGFVLVDIRITLVCVPNPGKQEARLDPSANITLRPFQAGDMAALEAIAREVHGDTRFFRDSHFPRKRAEELYAAWIRQDALGKARVVWVAASADNDPLGYISCHVDSALRRGQIGLVGVSPQARRKGIGKRLVLTALDSFWATGVDSITVVTSGSNLAAQRLYQQCGFLIQDLQLWYHKWYQGSEQ